MNDNEPHGIARLIVSAEPPPIALQRPASLRPAVVQAGIALVVLAVAWTADALR